MSFLAGVGPKHRCRNSKETLVPETAQANQAPEVATVQVDSHLSTSLSPFKTSFNIPREHSLTRDDVESASQPVAEATSSDPSGPLESRRPIHRFNLHGGTDPAASTSSSTPRNPPSFTARLATNSAAAGVGREHAEPPQSSLPSSSTAGDMEQGTPMKAADEGDAALLPTRGFKRTRNKALLWNLLALAAMGGILALVILGSSKIGTDADGANWHAISWEHPYIAALKGAPIYLQVKVLLPPADDQASGLDGVLQAEVTQGYRRRRRGLLVAAAPPSTTRRGMARGLQQAANATGRLPVVKMFVAQYNGGSGGGEGLLPAVFPAGWQPQDGPVQLATYNLSDWVVLTAVQRCAMAATQAVHCTLIVQNVKLALPGRPCYLLLTVNHTDQVAVRAQPNQLGHFGPAMPWCALAVLTITLLAIAFERIHRMWVAFIAAFFMLGLLLLANMAPSLDEAAAWVDYPTLGLLFGMMIIVGKLKPTGVFEVLVGWALRMSRGRMWVLTVLLCCVTGLLSAFLDNVTTMLLVSPMSIVMMRTVGRDPVPLLVIQAVLSNIGGAATMVGDPPNLIIGNFLSEEIGFVDFIINLAPGAILAFAVTLPCLMFMWRDTLMGTMDNYADVLQACDLAGHVGTVSNAFRITDWPMLSRSGYVTLVVVLGFLLQPIHQLNPAWFAILGATVLCLLDDSDSIHFVMESVEWDMLLFFGAMFVAVEAAVELGLIRKIAGLLTLMIQTAPPSAQLIAAINIIVWLSAIISAVLDNIPYTIAMLPVIQSLAESGLGLDLRVMAWALSFGACLGGNGTLIGASANIVTSGVAARYGYKISFVYWLRMGVPAMFISVAIADVYLMLRYAIGGGGGDAPPSSDYR